MKKALFSAACVITCCLGGPMPTQAGDMNAALDKFCYGVKEMNKLGLSAKPGTDMAAAVQRKANESAEMYRLIWRMAKNNRCSSIY